MRILLYILSAHLLISCNTREDYFEINNLEPTTSELELEHNTGSVSFETDPITISDTLKTSLTPSYNFKITLEDEVDHVIIKQTIREGDGTTKVNDVYIEENIPQRSSEIDLEFTPTKNGMNVVDYEFEDVYGKVTIVRLRLFSFKNNRPVAKFTYENTKLFNAKEYQISAETSFDSDNRYGGYISEYEFQIGLYYSVVTEKNYINHIFSEAGTYAVKVRVKDNDGAWSDFKTNIIVIN